MSRLNLAWYLVFGVSFAGLVVGRPWSFALGGFVLLLFALAVVTNWRGMLDRMPRGTTGPFAGSQGLVALRGSFLIASICGALLFVKGLVGLVA